MPSSHLILCCPLLLLPPIPPRIRVFSNESTLRMRWPKYWSWSFSFSIIPSKEIPGLISFRMDWLDTNDSGSYICHCWRGYDYDHVKSLSHVQLFATPWTVIDQAPLSMGFARQEYWSGLLFPSAGDFPSPGTEPRSPALQMGSLLSEPPG